MTNITRLHDINPEARERLLARIPEAPDDFDSYHQLRVSLQRFLNLIPHNANLEGLTVFVFFENSRVYHEIRNPEIKRGDSRFKSAIAWCGHGWGTPDDGSEWVRPKLMYSKEPPIARQLCKVCEKTKRLCSSSA